MEAILKSARDVLEHSLLVPPALVLLLGVLFASLFVAQQRAGKTLMGIAWYRDDNPILFWFNQIVLGVVGLVFIVIAVESIGSILLGP